jgi:hypothetical protein
LLTGWGLRPADKETSPAAAADHLAEERMARVGSNRIWFLRADPAS